MKSITAILLALAAAGGACKDYSSNPADPSEDRTGTASSLVDGQEGGRIGFGFNGTAGGRVFLTGGGSFVLASAASAAPGENIVSGGGGFRCVVAVGQGPLAGCGEGEGVRWNAVEVLANTTFRCSGADAPKPATTTPNLVIVLADFYRAGDGIEESFRAQFIVSDRDIAADVPGVQTLWVQGVGCDEAQVQLSSR